MLLGLLLLTTLAEPGADAWEPAKPPPPTPWAKAGGRSWWRCQELERFARSARAGDDPRGTTEATTQGSWRRGAKQCPHAVQLVTLAAEIEIVEAARLFEGVFPDEAITPGSVAPEPVDKVVAEHRERVEQAVAWLDAAVAESERRQARPPRGTLYYRAYGLTALGRADEARAALDDATRAGDVEAWRLLRMGALVELLRGDLGRALRLAQLGVAHAPAGERGISRYIRALVLDRAGAPAAAQAELRALRADSGVFARLAMESVLPIHEVMFVRALQHQANGDRSAAIRLWSAYLERPEVEEAERVLAKRHLQELRDDPPPAGGP